MSDMNIFLAGEKLPVRNSEARNETRKEARSEPEASSTIDYFKISINSTMFKMLLLSHILFSDVQALFISEPSSNSFFHYKHNVCACDSIWQTAYSSTMVAS